MSGLNAAIRRTIVDPAPSLKRLAWAFGCAKKGSDEESMLRDRLLAAMRRETGGEA